MLHECGGLRGWVQHRRVSWDGLHGWGVDKDSYSGGRRGAFATHVSTMKLKVSSAQGLESVCVLLSLDRLGC